MIEIKHVCPELSKAERIVSQVLDGDHDVAELRHVLAHLKEARRRAEVQLATLERARKTIGEEFDEQFGHLFGRGRRIHPLAEAVLDWVAAHTTTPWADRPLRDWMDAGCPRYTDEPASEPEQPRCIHPLAESILAAQEHVSPSLGFDLQEWRNAGCPRYTGEPRINLHPLVDAFAKEIGGLERPEWKEAKAALYRAWDSWALNRAWAAVEPQALEPQAPEPEPGETVEVEIALAMDAEGWWLAHGESDLTTGDPKDWEYVCDLVRGQCAMEVTHRLRAQVRPPPKVQEVEATVERVEGGEE